MNKLAIQAATQVVKEAVKNPNVQTAVVAVSVPVTMLVVENTYKLAKKVIDDGYELKVNCMFFDFSLTKA